MIRAIAAIDDARGIAATGTIPWRIPEDSQYFREQTEGNTVIMGRSTYEEFAEPLPNRRNIVISRSLTTVRKGFELIHDVDAFLQQTTKDVWIIGGAQLYAETLQYCNEIYLTHVTGNFNCDRFFPEYAQAFTLQNESSTKQSGGYSYTFAVYTQKDR